jgi:hypothetical protein
MQAEAPCCRVPELHLTRSSEKSLRVSGVLCESEIGSSLVVGYQSSFWTSANIAAGSGRLPGV